jgi:hypothetical protein
MCAFVLQCISFLEVLQFRNLDQSTDMIWNIMGSFDKTFFYDFFCFFG